MGAVRARFACVFAASPLSRAPDKTAVLRRLVMNEHDVTQKSSQTKLLLGKWVELGVELIVTKYVDRIWNKIRETSYLEIFKFSVSKGVLRNSQL